MIRLMQAVESAPMPTHPVIGASQITLTDIISEPYPGHSVVPNRCKVSYDRRLIPGEPPREYHRSDSIYTWFGKYAIPLHRYGG